MLIGTDNEGGGNWKAPPVDIYEAVIGCIESVGLQPGFKAGDSPRKKVVVGLELDWRDEKGRREVIFWKGLPMADRSTKGGVWLGDIMEAALPGRLEKIKAAGEPVDTLSWIGATLRVGITHDAKGKAKISTVLPSKAPGALKCERDYSQPFGLWSWLLKNRVDA